MTTWTVHVWQKPDLLALEREHVVHEANGADASTDVLRIHLVSGSFGHDLWFAVAGRKVELRYGRACGLLLSQHGVGKSKMVSRKHLGKRSNRACQT